MKTFELTYYERHRRTVHAENLKEADKLAKQFMHTLNGAIVPRDPNYYLHSIYATDRSQPK